MEYLFPRFLYKKKTETIFVILILSDGHDTLHVDNIDSFNILDLLDYYV